MHTTSLGRCLNLARNIDCCVFVCRSARLWFGKLWMAFVFITQAQAFPESKINIAQTSALSMLPLISLSISLLLSPVKLRTKGSVQGESESLFCFLPTGRFVVFSSLQSKHTLSFECLFCITTWQALKRVKRMGSETTGAASWRSALLSKMQLERDRSSIESLSNSLS